ncbi:MAG: DUF2207 domain-containing protein [Bacteroidetes bacterium]|nr:DUF2207 domain-containing protein [Bacteroidota bacterium]
MSRRIILVLLFLLSFSGFSVAVSAQTYQIPTISVEAEILDDGTIRIHETFTYRYEGSFSWAKASIPFRGFSEIQDIRVSEAGREYINENSEVPGTFSVSTSDDNVTIRWHYSAQDTTRKFTLSYTVTDALSVGPDYSEFFWNYLSPSRDKSTDSLHVSISLPDTVSTDQLYAWSRIPEEKNSVVVEPGRFTLTANNISRRESARLRILFPTSLFDSSVSVTDPELSLSTIVEQEKIREQEAEEKAEQRAFYRSITRETTIILSLLSLLLFIYTYRKYGTRHPVRSASDRETSVVPGRVPPALIGKLILSNTTTGNHLVATIFDLARRGWFTIQEKKPEEPKESGWFSSGEDDKSEFIISKSETPPDDSTRPYEAKLIDYISNKIRDGEDRFSKLFKGDGSAASTWFSEWKSEVKKEFDSNEWIDKTSYTGVTINIIGQVLLLAGSIYLLVMGTEFALIALAVACIMVVASFFIIRRTKDGEETYQRWKAYREGLKNADRRIIRMGLMDRHFIYAIAFHLNEKQISAIIESSDKPLVSMLPWIILLQNSATNPAALAGSLTTLTASGTSSFSGVSGGTGAVTGSAGGGTSASAG